MTELKIILELSNGDQARLDSIINKLETLISQNKHNCSDCTKAINAAWANTCKDEAKPVEHPAEPHKPTEHPADAVAPATVEDVVPAEPPKPIEPPKPVKTYSFADVQKLVIAGCQRGLRDQVKACLGDHAKASDLKPEEYPDFVAKMEALLAKTEALRNG